jgi:RNA polymerase sigma-70 factor (ECF subfamily)
MAPSAESLETLRPLLFTVPYQMTGSASVADDLAQDTYLRYQQTLSPEVIVDSRSLKAYLTTITTRLALDYMQAARHTREQYIGSWLPEPLLTDPAEAPADIVEREEMISLAFLVLLETLTPPERAVFVLREALDFSYDEIAPMLGKSVAACRQTFHRAHQRLATKERRFSVSHAAQRTLVASFLLASQQGQFDALAQALANDATLWSDGGGKAPAAVHPLHGAATIARYFVGLAREGARMKVCVAGMETNRAPTLLIWEDDALTTCMTCMTFVTDGDRIVTVYSQRNPEKLAFLGTQLARRRPSVSS